MKHVISEIDPYDLWPLAYTYQFSNQIVYMVIHKGVDLYPWLGGGGGMIGAQIFSAMDQSNQEVEACGKLHPSQAQPGYNFRGR